MCESISGYSDYPRVLFTYLVHNQIWIDLLVPPFNLVRTLTLPLHCVYAEI